MPQDKPRFKPWQLYSGLLCLAIGLASWIGLKQFQPLSATAESLQVSSASDSGASVSGELSLRPHHKRYDLNGVVSHVVSVPTSASLSIAVADGLKPLIELAQRENALYAINAGFFDPNNGKTTSHITVQGQVVGDPASNERLTGNPDLSPYMSQIFNRSEFRIYRCDASESPTYDITFHDAPPLAGCEIESAVGAGPILLPEDGSFAEAFTDYENNDPANGALIRDAIGSIQRNARSAIGLCADGSILLIMVEKDLDSQGMTLAELTEFSRSVGAVKLLNLDGGSSSSLYIADSALADSEPADSEPADSEPANPGESVTYFGRSDPEGNPIERPLKSVIVIQE